MDIIRDQVQSIQIDNQSDVGVCRRKGVSFASKLGFTDVESGEVAIMITEMVTNVIKHGGGKGHFMICRIRDQQNNTGMEVWCCDYGKGIPDIDLAVQDGYTDKLSLGIGLGAIRRLSDEFVINPERKAEFMDTLLAGHQVYQNCIRTRKWINHVAWVGESKNLVVGVASRPKPGEKVNGDSYVVLHLSDTISIAAVIDGLGHGKEANFASQLAKEQIIHKPDLPLEKLMNLIHLSLKGTRGATIGIVRIDIEKNNLSFSGIGNIEGQVNTQSKKNSLITFGGIVGQNMRTPRIFDYSFDPGDSVCLYSDGITSQWNREEINWSKSPQENSEYIINKYARIHDDATVLIIRYSP